MSKPQRQYFTQVLLAWRSSLVENHQDMKNNMGEDHQHFADPIDQGSYLAEMNNELANRARETKLVNKINQALLRIDDDYGFCDACGTEIGIPRLQARPIADLCIDCKSAAEIKDRSYAR